MFAPTDYIFAALLLFYFIYGWRKGLLNAIITPVSFLIFFIVGIINYDLRENMPKAIMIVIIGTISLSIIVRLLLIIGRAGVREDYRNFTFLWSRILGSMISLLWRGICTVLFLLLFTVLITQNSLIQRLQKNVTGSMTYKLIHVYIVGQIPHVQTSYMCLQVFRNPEEMIMVSSTQEYKDFFGTPHIKALAQDLTIMEHINNKEFFPLFFNPKIEDVMNDARIMKKFARLMKRVYQEHAKMFK